MKRPSAVSGSRQLSFEIGHRIEQHTLEVEVEGRKAWKGKQGQNADWLMTTMSVTDVKDLGAKETGMNEEKGQSV